LALVFASIGFVLYGLHYLAETATTGLRIAWVSALGLAFFAEVASRLVKRSRRHP
jgi:hypothetical protein